MILVILFIISCLGELSLVYAKKTGRLTTVIGGMSILLTSFVFSSLFIVGHWFLIPLGLVSGMRIVNIMRLTARRLPYQELKSRSLRTMIVGFIATPLTVLLYVVDVTELALLSIIISTLVVSGGLLLSVFLSIRTYRLKHRDMKMDSVPTVSVCIPARNETEDLPLCLASVLESTYPKLEVIVLDDCSHDKTPEVIKQFAHAGVRFIQGKEPPQDWQAKNAAYDRLTEEAKGEILLFCGVDVRFKPHTITQLVSELNESVDMLSLLPKRAKGTDPSLFIQPLRYWWEMALFRYKSKRPAVLSTCWLIRRKTLDKIGGFAPAKKAILPEAHFAGLIHQTHKYRFRLADHDLGLTSVKKPQDQLETGLRMRYPQLKRRPEAVLSLILIESVIFYAPLVGILYGLQKNLPIFIILSVAAMLLLTISHIAIFRLVSSKVRYSLLSVCIVPFVAAIDAFLMIVSMYRYEFDEVRWKERNVCIPLLRIEKQLPTLK